MRARYLLTALCAVAMAIGAHAETTLGPGSAAPALDIKTWLKGTPVTEFDPSKIYVVEFWATWCGPCKTSIPHLTEMAKKNTDVTFIGVSIWEDEEGDKIPKFVETMGDKMDYNVAYSGNQDHMAITWMKAAGQNGIPTAFVIKDQKVAWIGHPMNLEKPLDEIKAGTFDAVAYKADYDKEAAANAVREEAYKAVSAAGKLYTSGDKAGAKTALDATVSKYPSIKSDADNLRYGWLANDDAKAWLAKSKQMAASGTEQNLQMMAIFALDQTQAKKHADLAKQAADMAAAANKKNFFSINYYTCMFYMQTKDNAKALALTNKMLDNFATSEVKDDAEFKATLLKQKESLEAKVALKN